eukprot:Hpha_TRINITY_DN20480_c0_g1::TRINITY_DN20480_c0_g1_i1::g.64180::m.64180/K01134/ARSA; arylsulfatase A
MLLPAAFVLRLTLGAAAVARPNFVLLLADDLGYGDLGAYGHPTSSTPNLDRMAREGRRFTQFYAGSPVCTPSRATLMTGRYIPRTGIYCADGDDSCSGVFAAGSDGGLPLSELTLGELLGGAGYDTKLVGKWHLGIGTGGEYMPWHQGFVDYEGLPYSHVDCPMTVCFFPNVSCDARSQPVPADLVACPLYVGDQIVQQPVDMLTLTERYTRAAEAFIRSHTAAEQPPFFLYFAYQHVHGLQFAGEQYTHSTARGEFGDSLAELDGSVGRVLDAVRAAGLAASTFVFFFSDNGPSLQYGPTGGSAGLFRCGKGTTYEGGQRVPAIAWWPSRVPAASQTHALSSGLDILPTFASLAGVPLPNATIIDGVDLSAVLFADGAPPRDSFMYYPQMPSPGVGLFAARGERYKAHYITKGSNQMGNTTVDTACHVSTPLTRHSPPLFYDLLTDPSEQSPLDVSDPRYRQALAEIDAKVAAHKATLTWTNAKSQLSRPQHDTNQPCCTAGCTPWPECCSCDLL